MAFIPLYRVWETTSTDDTGDYDLDGAVADDANWGSFVDFDSQMDTSDTCFYTCIGVAGGAQAWEVGLGTFTSGSPDTLARTTIFQSYTDAGGIGTSAVDWDTGNHNIYGSIDPGAMLLTTNNLSDLTDTTAALSNLGAMPLAGGTITGGVTMQGLISFSGLTTIMRAAAGAHDVRICRVQSGSSMSILVNLDEDDEYTKASAEAVRIEIDKDGDNNFRIYYADGVTPGRSIGDDATIDWMEVVASRVSNSVGGLKLNGAATIFSGSGTPSASTGSSGDIYIDTGGSGSGGTDNIYFNNGGTWQAIA